MILLQHTLWGQLILVLLFSFLTGMELRDYHQQFHANDKQKSFGTIRTYAFTGLLGFVFYLIDPNLYLVGFVALTAIYLLLYWHKLEAYQPSILNYLVWTITYSYAPLVMTQPLWVVASVFVISVLLLGSKVAIHAMAAKLDTSEITTLAKLVLLSVVILPLLPHEVINQWVPVSPFKIWLAVVVVSSISYLGYISQRYFFPNQGALLTGIFGGIYSSTATTVALSKKSIDYPRLSYKMTAAILVATGLMYLRLLGIAAVFNWQVALHLWQPMMLLAILIFIATFTFMHLEHRHGVQHQITKEEHHNPLELKIAFVFAGLFVVMAVVTQAVTQYFGEEGLRYLSLIVGFTDIDPFVLSLLNGQYHTTTEMIASAVLIAAGSNNLLKAVYAYILAEPKAGKYSATWLIIFGVITIALGWFY